MKQVYCLYRVSTNKQLYENDIPMQRQACQEFANAHGWTIIKEFYEKGISGFKTPTCDRQVLQQIEKDAKLRKFDVLLVFMFDRVGRRDSETPFFIEELAMSGVEIWSVKEGQQKFESHVDKLLNYIRYWQASGESLKTSERIKTRMAQLTQEGLYTGGSCPYGYRLVYKGRRNPRGYEIHDLEIDQEEALVIQKIFDYYIHYGYGNRKIASELAAQGIFNRNGEVFHYSSIASLLHREQLTGILRRGDNRSGLIPELQIISPDTFVKAHEIMQKRREGSIPRRVAGKALLSGNIYCGHCGGRMFASTARKSHHNTDCPAERIPIYKCYHRSQYRGRCPGPTSYRAHRIDEIVLNRIQEYCTANPQLNKFYTHFEQAEHPVRKMIVSQWIERVMVFSYESVEVEFIESIETFVEP